MGPRSPPPPPPRPHPRLAAHSPLSCILLLQKQPVHAWVILGPGRGHPRGVSLHTHRWVSGDQTISRLPDADSRAQCSSVPERRYLGQCEGTCLPKVFTLPTYCTLWRYCRVGKNATCIKLQQQQQQQDRPAGIATPSAVHARSQKKKLPPPTCIRSDRFREILVHRSFRTNGLPRRRKSVAVPGNRRFWR